MKQMKQSIAVLTGTRHLSMSLLQLAVANCIFLHLLHPDMLTDESPVAIQVYM